jgi:hypothetical protein
MRRNGSLKQQHQQTTISESTRATNCILATEGELKIAASSQVDSTVGASKLPKSNNNNNNNNNNHNHNTYLRNYVFPPQNGPGADGAEPRSPGAAPRLVHQQPCFSKNEKNKTVFQFLQTWLLFFVLQTY